MSGRPEASSIGRDTLAVAALALAQAALSISLVALVFTGPIAHGLPRAITITLVSAGVVAIVVGRRSRFDGLVAGAQDIAIIVLLAILGPIVAAAGDDAVTTVIVLMGLCSAGVGLGMIAAAALRLGTIIQHLPLTVIGAFAAGTGWLLMKGGIDVAVDDHIGLAGLGGLFETPTLWRWLPAVVLGVTIAGLGAARRAPTWTVSATILLAAVGFHVVVAIGSSLTAVEDDGWLIGPFPSSTALRLISLDELRSVPWGTLLANGTGIATLIAVSVIGLLLNLSALEVQAGERIPVDHEVRSAGIANLAIAPLGGVVGYHLLGDSLLARRMGVRGRTIPALVGVVLVASGLIGGESAGLLPRLVAGGVLVGVGLSLLVPWLAGLRAGVGWPERLLGLGVVVSMATIGVLEAVVLGVVAAGGLFVARYSRIDPVRLAADGGELRSSVDRSADEAGRLQATNGRRRVFELQGYLFFGSASRLADRVRTLLATADDGQGVIVFDLRHVTGIDATARSVLDDLDREILDAGWSALWAGLRTTSTDSLTAFRDRLDSDGRSFADLDRALEVAEAACLDGHEGSDSPVSDGLPDGVRASMTLRSVDAGTTLAERGEPSDSMYVVQSGWVSAYGIDDDGQRHRLRRFGPGGLVGELGFVSGAPRSADVAADTDVELLVLDRRDYDRLRQEDPEAATELLQLIVQTLADRLASLSDRHTRSLR